MPCYLLQSTISTSRTNKLIYPLLIKHIPQQQQQQPGNNLSCYYTTRNKQKQKIKKLTVKTRAVSSSTTKRMDNSNINNTQTNNVVSSDNDYEKAIELLHSQISKTKSSILTSSLQRKNTIESMQTYLEHIGIKHNKWNIPFIHITGSKGKGSTAIFTESILRNRYGYHTGLFTSPHLINVNERMRLDSKPIQNKDFAIAYLEVRRRLLAHCNEEEDKLPTYFRMLTLVAIFIFQNYQFSTSCKKGVDVVIMEVGMGGRYDATNILPKVISSGVNSNTPFVCGVTLIDYDHTRILGNTLEEIAWEKGGIFRHSNTDHNKKTPSLPQCSINHNKNSSWKHFHTIPSNKEAVLDVLRKCTTEKISLLDESNYERTNILESKLLLPQTELNIVSIDNDKNGIGSNIGIPGDHQKVNAELAYHLSKSLIQQINYSKKDSTLDEESNNNDTISPSVAALQKAFWPGRCHTIIYKPNVYLHIDGAHTLHSVKAYLSWLCNTHLTSNTTKSKKTVLIFNCSHERDPVGILSVLQKTLAEYSEILAIYFCYADSERPSMISKPTTLELLHATTDVEFNNNNSKHYDDCTWQHTLANIWKELRFKHTTDTTTINNNHDIITDVNVGEVLKDIQTKYSSKNDEIIHVCITGSLYIAGSALRISGWKEDYHMDGTISLLDD